MFDNSVSLCRRMSVSLISWIDDDDYLSSMSKLSFLVYSSPKRMRFSKKLSLCSIVDESRAFLRASGSNFSYVSPPALG